MTQDILIVGGGLAGLTTALACHHRGLNVHLMDARTLTGRKDARASFLARSSLRMLDRLGVEIEAQPVTDILAAEGRPGEPVSSGSLHFRGQDVGGDLGAIVENSALHAAMLGRLRQTDTAVSEQVVLSDFQTDIGAAHLTTNQGTLSARLVIAADGRNSILRRLAGFDVQTHDYGQSALTFTIAHGRPHDGVAYQIFFPGGPLALLPLAGERSSVVWTDTPRAIRAATSLSASALMDELRARIGDTLGELTLVGAPQSYPLSQSLTDTVMADRLALVGDAAHVIHPLAGQGLNLALRDAAALSDILNEARSLGRDLGGPALRDYARWREGDIPGMALATDALSHAYALRGPLASLRRLTTGLIDRSDLGSWISREAAGERPNLPVLMR